MQDTTDKKKIKLIYRELQGYLSQLPMPKDSSDTFFDKDQWEFINNAIDRLNSITGENYDNFKTNQTYSREGHAEYVTISGTRSKLGALINIIHESYFSDEPAPFSGSSKQSGINITNQNSQQQTQQQYMTVTLFELRDKIDERLPKVTDEKEKTFLTKLKEQLPTIISMLQLIQTMFAMAQLSGLDINEANHSINSLLA